MELGETTVMSRNFDSPSHQMSLLQAAILNGHRIKRDPDSPLLGDAPESLLRGESRKFKNFPRAFYTSDPRLNGLPLDMSMKLEAPSSGAQFSDEEDSVNSHEESKYETDPSSPATGSFDGDNSVSPESLEQLSISQEPTLIVNGLDIYYKCKLCFKVFSTEQRWKRHKQDTHFNPRLHICPICGERFKRSTHLKRHQDRRHQLQTTPAVKSASIEKRRFSCSQCPRVFERAHKLLGHIQQYHQNKRPYRCETCNEGFKRQDHLNRHRESKSHKLRLVLANKPEYGDDVINCADVPKEMMRSFASHNSLRSQNLISLVQSGKLRHLKHIQPELDLSNELHVQIDPPSAYKSLLLESSERETTLSKIEQSYYSPASSADDSLNMLNMSLSKSTHSLNGSEDTSPIMEATGVPTEPGNSFVELDHEINGSSNKDESVSCALCGKVFESEKRMKIHLRQTHSSERRHICRLCGERFKRSTHLRRHLNSNKHQRISQAKGHLKSEFGDLDSLTEDDISRFNNSSRGHGRFPASLYLNDYDDIPISMVPRSFPLRLDQNESQDEDSKDEISMETEDDNIIVKSETNNNQPKFTDDLPSDDPYDFSKRRTLKPKGLISLLDRKKVYPRTSSPIKGDNHVGSHFTSIKDEARNGEEFTNEGWNGVNHDDDLPRSTLRSLLQSSTSSYHNNNNNTAAMSYFSMSSDNMVDEFEAEDFDHSKYVIDMSHKYSIKPWECALCQSFFEERRNVLNHIRKVHGGRQHPCDYCDKSYKAKTDLHKHLTKIHGNTLDTDLTPEANTSKDAPKSVSRRKKSVPRKVLFHVETDVDGMDTSGLDPENGLEEDDDLDPEDDLDPDIDLDEVMLQAEEGGSPPDAAQSDEEFDDSEMSSVDFVKLNTINNRTNFECRICHKVFSARPNLHTHLRQIHQNVRPFGCQYCGETFKRGTHLRLHISRRHYIDVISRSLSTDMDGNYDNTPRVLYRNPTQNLHNSLLPNSKNIWKCTRCPKSFPKRDLFQHHMKLHLAAEKCACPFCDKVFTHEKHLQMHIRSHEDEPRYVCSFCNVSFLIKSAFLAHMEEHAEGLLENHDEEMEITPELDRKPQHNSAIRSGMPSPWKIKTENASDNRVKPMKVTDPNVVKEVIVQLETLCAVCGEEFDNMDSLRAHTRAHRKPYCCQYCNKKYDNISYLERHTRVHTGSKPYVCSVCNRGFPRKERAEEHIVKYH